MAHYVSELIEAVRTAAPEEREAAQDRCAAAIRELWAERASLPRHARPFEPIERLIRTLEAIDPDRQETFYRPDLWRHVEEDQADCDEGATPWLSLARNLDFTARMMMDEVLNRAAAEAINKDASWLRVALHAGETEGVDIQLQIRLIETLKSARHREYDIKRLRDRLDRLSGFVETASLLRTSLEERLTALEADSGEGDTPRPA